ncbi:AAA family ATPase [bacterium]|nr:AAA family ATPase [bacterium]
MERQTLQITDNLERLLEIFPRTVRKGLELHEDDLVNLIEVVMDLGRLPQARLPESFHYLSQDPITREDLRFVTERVGQFGPDNRAGIEATLHRISAIRNRVNDVVGVTCRVGRAIYGTEHVIRDVVESGKSILLLGRPGVGKTTLLREVARVLADDIQKRVVIVDTSNEIAGDGDIPHPGIGMARRMQVPHDSEQHSIMIEAVENHMPQVIVVDEIGTEQEAYAARTIAERGVTLVATAHGNTLENLMQNPTLSDLIGGISSVTLSDEEARRRGTQKSILERKAPPCFDVLIEIQDKDTFAIHGDVASTVDLLLRGQPVKPEVRLRKGAGKVEVVQTSNREFLEYSTQDDDGEVDRYADGRLAPAPPGHEPMDGVRIFPYSVSRNRLERAIRSLGVSAQVVRSWEFADMVVTLKEQVKKRNFKFDELRRRNIPVHLVRANTVTQLQAFLKQYFRLQHLSPEEFAQREAKEAIKQVRATGQPVDLSPQTAPVRRLQHEWAEAEQLKSSSFGVEPERFVRIYA